MANHSGCHEGIYWGDARFSGSTAFLYRLIKKGNRNKFQGHSEDSPLYWGNTCKERIKYVRNFVFRDINNLKACPWMPYHDPKRPYVNYWFASSEGPQVDSYVSTTSEIHQDRL